MNGMREGAGRFLWPALGLGLAADALFRVEGIGLNALLWLGAAVCAWWYARRRTGEMPGPAERALLLALLAVGCAAMWRENPLLRLLDALAVVVCAVLLPVVAVPEGSFAFWNLAIDRLVLAIVHLIRRGMVGLVPSLLDASRTSNSRPNGGARTAASIARGTILTIPALLLFGGLLGHADPVFGSFLEDIVRVDVDRLVNHSLVILAASWIAAAFLSGVLTEERGVRSGPAATVQGGLGRVEVGMMLGLLNLLFAAFIAFQFPYFFGGAAWVEQTAGITLAEYARKGFFELVVVSALVLPLLLAVHSRLRVSEAAVPRLYRSLAAWQVLLVLTMMASAIHRMALYQREFGLTEDRFFASAFMGGLAVTFCWFGATVLRNSAGRFAGGALVAWAGWLVLLHAINPERVVVRTNLARAEAGKPLDTRYLTQLTSDATPALIDGLAGITGSGRSEVEAHLRSQQTTADLGWRAWHFGRAAANRRLAQLN